MDEFVVAVVEDEEHIREQIAEIVEKAGEKNNTHTSVKPFPQLEEFISAINDKSCTPNLIILDLKFGDGDYDEGLKAIDIKKGRVALKQYKK